jgi:ParB/RepB/Spo0J family partition protein
MTEITNLSVSQIVAGNNDRREFDPVKLEELAASIAAHGLAQPITVRPLGGRAPTFEIVAGERRFRAISRILEWDTIPAIIRELDDEAASAIMLAENTGRADLNPIEEARAYESRIRRFGWTPERIADIAGVSADLVRRRVSLLSLAPDIQHMVAFGHLPIGHAEAMARLDRNRQMLAVRVLREKENVPLRLFRQIVNQLYEEQSQEALFDLASFWVQQVQEDGELPRKGKHAVTGAPTRDDLPEVPTLNTIGDTTGAVLDRYIVLLQRAGFSAEAAALGNLYNALVRGNYTAVPAEAALLVD